MGRRTPQHHVGLPNDRKGFHKIDLTFGSEAVIPVKIGLPSPRAEQYEPEANREAMEVAMDLLEENRLQAAVRMASYQQKM